ncbi:hypothetical protein [Amycolatopsis suaedae]|uniref:hypothetical protein n=1 Tax=Amycolatopsis suaedae TaxID=2510978 RepID=UPI0013EF5769|nr:hypothetical protein [Amycolatopsis suaedae]
MRTRRIHLTILSCLLALAACGSEDPGEHKENSTQQSLLGYASCMRENGIDLPDPAEGDPGSLYQGIDQTTPAFTAAHTKCAHLLQGLVDERQQQNGGDQAQQHEEMLALAACLRERGIDVPDPVQGAEKPFGDSLDRTDPAVAEAIKACSTRTPASR